MIYVCQLSASEQNEIRQRLLELGIADEDIELAMNSKVNDLDYLMKERN